jgi:hypothetical protein
MMMHYVLLYNETAAEVARGIDPAQSEAYWGAWNAYIGAMSSAGVMHSGNGLSPPHTGTTLRIENGTRHVQDGPYPDTKEMLGGYVVLDVPDLDAALAWAASAPCVTAGSVEVRPVMSPPGE